ncbi:uncharacterized protein ASCRUDRAFT_76148, partial [Ascoidea rubescens DSM 1968]
ILNSTNIHHFINHDHNHKKVQNQNQNKGDSSDSDKTNINDESNDNCTISSTNSSLNSYQISTQSNSESIFNKFFSSKYSNQHKFEKELEYLNRNITFNNKVFWDLKQIEVKTSDPLLITVFVKLNSLENTLLNHYNNLKNVLEIDDELKDLSTDSFTNDFNYLNLDK